jgi:hypothetical protein
VDVETRRQKQQALMIRMVERLVRERAQQLYDARGQEDGHALNDWVQAESEVIENMAIGKLYRRLRITNPDSEMTQSASDSGAHDDYPSESTA